MLPTLNEVDNIVPLIEGIYAAVPDTHEVIVVDDDSSDGTGDAVRAYAAAHPERAVRLELRTTDHGLTKSIAHGVRNGADPEARDSQMPAFLTDGILKLRQVEDVSEFVLKLSGQQHDEAKAGQGAAIFAEQCVACHGDKGQGNKEFGAPALNNNIWLYGGDRAAIVETVSKSRRGEMPAWGRILDPVTVKQLAIYVHSLGGGH